MRWLESFLANESGVTAIEYALIASGIAMAIIAAVNTLGQSIQALFTTLAAMF
jgi:pilus assembly protein Flp/PilA